MKISLVRGNKYVDLCLKKFGKNNVIVSLCRNRKSNNGIRSKR